MVLGYLGLGLNRRDGILDLKEKSKESDLVLKRDGQHQGKGLRIGPKSCPFTFFLIIIPLSHSNFPLFYFLNSLPHGPHSRKRHMLRCQSIYIHNHTHIDSRTYSYVYLLALGKKNYPYIYTYIYLQKCQYICPINPM